MIKLSALNRTILVTSFLIVVLPCFVFAGESTFNASKLSKIWINRTTEKQLLELLGEPQNIKQDSKHDRLFSYHFITEKKGQFINGLLMAPLAVLGGVPPENYYEIEHELFISLDSEGIVKAFEYAGGDEILKAFINEDNQVQVVSNQGKSGTYSQSKGNSEFLSHINED